MTRLVRHKKFLISIRRERMPSSAKVAINDLSEDALPARATHAGAATQILEVQSDKVQYTKDYITSTYSYSRTEVEMTADRVLCVPRTHEYTFRTGRKVPKTGMMLIGWAGNNGSTVTASILANKLNISWNRKEGECHPNYYGSLTQATTIRIGNNAEGKEIHIPFSTVLPMVHPNNLVIGGWDINDANIADAMQRAAVLDYDLQRQLRPHLENLKPLPSIYYPDFIAANQSDRANNTKNNQNKQEDLDAIRQDIRDFKEKNDLDKVIIVWTANTERFTDVRPGLNTTAVSLLFTCLFVLSDFQFKFFSQFTVHCGCMHTPEK